MTARLTAEVAENAEMKTLKPTTEGTEGAEESLFSTGEFSPVFHCIAFSSATSATSAVKFPNR